MCRSSSNVHFVMILIIISYALSCHQYVNIPTRGTRTLDKCYGNIQNGYKALAKPPLGNSDHKIIQLIPKYRQKLKRQKPTTRRVKVWTNDTTETLRACFDCTDWDVLLDSSSIDEAAEHVLAYVYNHGHSRALSFCNILLNKR